MASFTAEELAQLEEFIERGASPERRLTQVEAVGILARLALTDVIGDIKREAEMAAWEKENPSPELLVDIDLDEEQLAQIDALIEEHSTPTHRVTREAMLHILVERGRKQVEQGTSLLPYLELPEDETAPAPASDDTTRH